MDSCPDQLAQRPLRKKDITNRSVDPVLPKLAKSRLHPPPRSRRRSSSWRKTPWPPKNWRSPIAQRL